MLTQASKFWRRAIVVAILKPNNQESKSYIPISLLCVFFKILERLIYARIELIIDPLLPREQAGFWRGRSTVDPVTFLTQEIENSFSVKRPRLCLSISQQSTLLYATVASSTSYSVFFRTGTWSH